MSLPKGYNETWMNRKLLKLWKKKHHTWNIYSTENSQQKWKLYRKEAISYYWLGWGGGLPAGPKIGESHDFDQRCVATDTQNIQNILPLLIQNIAPSMLRKPFFNF